MRSPGGRRLFRLPDVMYCIAELWVFSIIDQTVGSQQRERVNQPLLVRTAQPLRRLSALPFFGIFANYRPYRRLSTYSTTYVVFRGEYGKPVEPMIIIHLPVPGDRDADIKKPSRYCR